jgi:hypothetical protein
MTNKEEKQRIYEFWFAFVASLAAGAVIWFLQSRSRREEEDA